VRRTPWVRGDTKPVAQRFASMTGGSDQRHRDSGRHTQLAVTDRVVKIAGLVNLNGQSFAAHTLSYSDRPPLSHLQRGRDHDLGATAEGRLKITDFGAI